jgi:7-cyano-7-deazaguanine synthase
MTHISSTPAAARAVILVSGGLDSATTLAIAKASGHACYTLAFDYGQRHRSELVAAQNVSRQLGAVEHKVVHLDLNLIGGSALTDTQIAVPERQLAQIAEAGIPVTYVPARNTIFLSIALGWAEVLGAQEIFIGVNAVDYSGYPDCRPDYIQAFEAMARLATRAGVENQPLHIRTPLMTLGKAEIIREGTRLGVDFGLTVSCYQADALGRACGRCDSCLLRRQGFLSAGVTDPTRYQ